jgi:glutaredoxin-related protein
MIKRGLLNRKNVSTKIADILQNIVSPEVAWKVNLFKSWPDIVGKLADKVTIFAIEQDRLVLQTMHPAWAQELNFLSPLILEKISGLVGPNVIRTISFKIIRRQAAQFAQHATRNGNPLHSLATSSYVMTKQEAAKLDVLQDEQLRTALRDYLLRTKARM